jgi:ribosomal protein L12E/L44/L45/RPP1/RPP2
MSVKTFTFRYDSDGDIGKWMAAQVNKSVSLELAIQTLIGNFDYQDLREAIPRQVTLNAVDVNAAKPKKKTRKPKAKKNKQAPENVDKPKQEEPSSKPDKKTKDNDDDANLDMFSSL